MLQFNVNICVIIIGLATLTSNTVAPTATPKVVKLIRAIVLDSNPIVSSLNDFDVSFRFIEILNRPTGTLFGLKTDLEALFLSPNSI